ncbi:TPA: DNA protecting protein DprA, partial [Enterococcus faecium]|nr:DNA protecting protein DprA [Enterococcus faecium]
MMYQIEENLLKLAYTKGISSQGKWALANWMMQYPYKEIGFEDII